MRQKTHQKLLTNFEKIARVMSNNYDVEIKMSENMAATDGRIIYLPIHSDLLQGVAKKVLHGKLDHECAHVEEEDRHIKAGKETPIQLLKRCKSKKECLLINVFEDIRIETRKSKKYIGIAENLKELSLYSAKLHRESWKENENKEFWHQLGCAIIFLVQGQKIDWLPVEFNSFIDVIRDEIEESKNTNWVSDSYRLAKNVLKKIEDLCEELEKDNIEVKGSKDSEEGSKDSEEGSRKNFEEGPEGSEEGSKDSEEGSKDSEEGSRKNFEEGPEGSEEGSKDSEEGSDKDLDKKRELAKNARGDSSVKDLGVIINEDLKNKTKEIKKLNCHYYSSPIMKKFDSWEKPRVMVNTFNNAKKDVSSQLRGLKSKLVNLVKSRELSTMVFDKNEGEIDSDVLSTVSTGNKRIYSQEILGESLDIAISILVDESGSMGSSTNESNCAYFAQRATIGLAETFSSLNIPFEIIGFQNIWVNHHKLTDGVKNSGSRSEPFLFNIYKDFKEKYRKVKYRLGSIEGGGNNCDGEAVLETAKRLSLRTEERKILIVISDGAPRGGGVSHIILEKHLKEIVKKVSDSGIEVLGIGAGSKEVTRFYTKENGASCIVVDDLNKLAITVYKGMKDLLLKKNM